MEWRRAPVALPGPRRLRKRAYWALRYVPLLREAALADSVSGVRSHFEPGRGLPERRLPVRLVVAGALPGPGGEVGAGGEDAHVDAELGDQHLGGRAADAGDRLQQVTLAGERGDHLLDPLREVVIVSR